MKRLSEKAKNAVFIGTLCSVSYFAVYIARNILSAVTPQMISHGYSEDYIGLVSSAFFICYAVGQLINGLIGDKIHAKWMICTGLFGAGVANIAFMYTAPHKFVALSAYALVGFFLSMIYGPMTKVVSENTEPIHAVRCSLGYTFASFFGTPAAGFLASFLVWQSVFKVSSSVLFVMATLGFVIFSLFERRGIIKYGVYKKETGGVKNVKILLKRSIIKFSLVSILTGIVRTSVVFWLPTYISQYLSFSPKSSARIYTAASIAISLTAFIAVFVYEKIFKHNMNKTLFASFTSSAIFFALTFLVKIPFLNIALITLAIMSSNSAATMLWSIYCPSLRDTGMVSMATGFLDFLSYMAAALANVLFASAITDIGWGNLILVWASLTAVGALIAFPYKSGKMKQTA